MKGLDHAIESGEVCGKLLLLCLMGDCGSDPANARQM